LTKFPTAPVNVELRGKTERQLALTQRNREDVVFDALIEVLEETPGVLSAEYCDDFLCDLIRSHHPDVTTAEIVKALDLLSARAVALRESMRTDDSDLRSELPAKRRCEIE
jgi:hypothetical protein